MNSTSTESTDPRALSDAELDEVTGGLSERDLLRIAKVVETVVDVVKTLAGGSPQV